MAANIPESRSLATWEDAFQHPLPVVRKLEQQLRRNIEENRQRLRSLVGASYRDLLGTAERIIEMDEQIQQVEGHFGDVGRKCNARTAERVQRNHTRMRKERIVVEQRKYGRLAQTKMLQSALAVTLRIIRSGGDALLASKVLVLARLLHKSVVETDEEPPAVLEDLAKRSRMARERLLSYITRSLGRANADRTYTVHSLCAYSMTTSSAPRDVLRYFLQVRFAQLEAKIIEITPTEGDLLEALELFQRTLADTRDLFPRRFADALSQVSEATLVRDHDVRSIDELGLDIYEQWVTEDVRNFKPWTRHEQVLLSEVKDALASWTRQAQACLLQGVTGALEQQNDAEQILVLRQKVLSRFLSFSIMFRDDAHVRAITDVRVAFTIRLEQILGQAAQLTQLSLDLPEGSDANDLEMGPDSWSLASADFDLSRGAKEFRLAISRREYGRSQTVQRIADLLDEWVVRIQKGSTVVSSLRSTRWNDDVDLDLDELEDSEAIIAALSKQDPQQLSSRLQEAIKESLGEAYKELQKQSSGSGVAVAATIIRAVRELDLRRRILAPESVNLDSVKFDHKITEELHQRVASFVSDNALKQYARRARTGGYIATALWDGEPALPAQPAPVVFKLLMTVHREMSQAGQDLWSPEAVRVIKAYLADQLEKQHLFDIDHDTPAEQRSVENGDDQEVAAPDDDNDAAASLEDAAEQPLERVEGSPDTAREQRRHRLLQHTFDGMYLQHVLSTGGDGDGRLQRASQKLASTLELDDVAQARLRKSAMDYWRKTYLLFGLLAGHQAV